MKWTRAVHHLEGLASKCAELAAGPASIHPLQVVQLWAVGDILGNQRDLDWVKVAVVVDRPVDEVPWLSQPPGSQHWSSATRLAQNPIVALWRSARAPVWNHYIERPAPLWDLASGVAEETLAALREGRGEEVRIPAPTPAEFHRRLEEELAVSLRALRARSEAYDAKRWRPGRIEPASDALWRATDGYLDVLDAIGRA